MLGNPRNAGHRTYQGKIVVDGTWEPVVSEELYRATVDAIAARSYRRATPPARRHLGQQPLPLPLRRSNALSWTPSPR